MLHFNKIILENFGPYKGEKCIDFTNRDGVTIVWGNNGLGKTTLLNAFKYALFGKIVNRENVQTNKKELINWESFMNGIHRFKVVLHFGVDDDIYILSREFSLRSPEMNPEDEKNYIDYLSINKNGAILSPSDCEHVINSIMPEQVSRFFLFDGELLQEYEDLLHEDKGIGQKIKNAIEEILGVPVLSNARSDMSLLESEYMSELQAAAQKNSDLQLMANAIARANAELESEKANKKNLTEDKEKLEAEISELRITQAKNERINGLLVEIGKQNDIITKSESLIDSNTQMISDFSGDLWKQALNKTLNTTIENLSSRMEQLTNKQEQHLVADHLLSELKESLEKRHCIVCESDLSIEKQAELKKRIDEYAFEYSDLTSEEESELDALKHDITMMRGFLVSDQSSVISVLEQEIIDAQVDIADAKSRKKSLEKEIDDYSRQKNEMDQVARDLEKRIILLDEAKKSIAKIDENIAEISDRIQKAKQKLTSSSKNEADMLEATRKHSFCSELSELMEQSLDEYRQYLKEQVQEDATKIFINLSNNKHYSRLDINENYGLNIIHETGKMISIRSAGFEHVVALSLIGALHQNAPLQGPIVMDSPFIRLDSVHEDNILRYLPEMANQVMLFVYDKEINDQKARINLGPNLIQEFKLEQGDTFETIIRRN